VIARPAQYGLYRIEFESTFDPTNILRVYEIRFYREIK